MSLTVWVPAGQLSLRRLHATCHDRPVSEADLTPCTEMVDLGDQRLATARWGDGQVEIVMLHDGLGSISQWRDVPAVVARRTGAGVLAYERAGHGSSTPVPSGPWPADWLHREASVLGRLLDELGIEAPLIVGHSDGGSTALIHAASPNASLRGVVAIAPHTWVEDICWQSIVDMRANTERFVFGLSRHHDAPAEIFEAWSGVWVSDAFRSWDIRPTLHAIDVPAIIVQGTDDAYASDDQVHSSVAAIGPNARGLLLPGIGHIAHHDDPDAVVDVIVDAFAALDQS